MTTPLFDIGGLTVNDPADGYHTNSEINAFVDAIRSVAPSNRALFFQAVRRHWDHQHFTVAPDNLFLTPAADGSIKVSTLPFDYSTVDGHEGLDLPPE